MKIQLTHQNHWLDIHIRHGDAEMKYEERKHERNEQVEQVNEKRKANQHILHSFVVANAIHHIIAFAR